MPEKSIKVPVEPKVLVWARKTLGLSIQQVVARLKLSEEAFTKWEMGEEGPTAIQLEKLADIYKRPLAVFFLREPPKEPALPKDFRTVPEMKEIPLAPETRLAVRRARRLQSLAQELSKAVDRKSRSKLAKVGLDVDVDRIAAETRLQLGVEPKAQRGWKSQREAVDKWKQAIEGQGVLVAEMAMQEGIRGFSLTHHHFPIIALNIRDALTARVFSLFHEYGHLLLNDGGICDWREIYERSGTIGSTERFCNHFAGVLLVPEGALRNHHLVDRTTFRDEWPEQILKRLGRDFKVSQEVILRRLVTLSLSTTGFYEMKREEWKSQVGKRKGRKKSEWPRNMPRECIRERGTAFVSLVLDNHREGKITSSDVADYLGVRLKHLPKIEELITSGR